MARTTASGRTDASNRLAIRNFPYSLNFSNNKRGTVTNFDPTGDNGKYLSVASWIYHAPGTVSDASISQFDYGTNQRSWSMLMVTGDYYTVIISTDGGIVNSKRYSSYIPYADGQWHLLGFTWDNGTLTLYVDGAAITPNKLVDVAFTTLHLATCPITLGSLLNFGNTASFFSGDCCQHIIWSDVLTPTEWSNLYYKNTVPQDNLEAEWLASEGSGATVADSSGNGRDATLTSVAAWSSNVPFVNRTTASGRTQV